MKKWLTPSALLTLVLSGWILPKAAAWLLEPASPSPPPIPTPKQFVADAAYRHQHCQPHHWRTLMLKRR